MFWLRNKKIIFGYTHTLTERPGCSIQVNKSRYLQSTCSEIFCLSGTFVQFLAFEHDLSERNLVSVPLSLSEHPKYSR